MRVSVQRLEPTTSSQTISWSDDGIVAVSAAAGGVTLFSYGANAATGGSERPLRYEIPESEQQLIDNVLSNDCAIGIGGTRRQTVAVDWSKTGAGPNYSCALAVLKCNGNSYVYCSKAGAGGTWAATDLGVLIAGKLGIDYADPVCAKRLRIRALSWHRNKTLLAAASEAGDFYVLEFVDGICTKLSADQIGEMAVALCWREDQVVAALASGAVLLVSNKEKLYENSKRPVSIHCFEGKLVVIYCKLAVVINGDKADTKELQSMLPIVGLLPWDEHLVAIFDDGSLESINPDSSLSSESVGQIERKFGLKAGRSKISRVHGVAVARNIPCAAVLASCLPDDVWHYPIPSTFSSTLRLKRLPGSSPEFKPSSISNVTWKEWLAIAKSETSAEPDLGENEISWPTGPWESPAAAVAGIVLSPRADQVRDKVLQGFEPALIREMRQQIANAVLSCDLTEYINSDVDKAVKYMLSQLASSQFGEPLSPLTLKGDGIECAFELSGQDPFVNEVRDTQNRKWRRCALTRMPLLTCDTHSASESPFVRLNPTNYDQGLTKLLLSAIPFCPFDGSRWQSRKD